MAGLLNVVWIAAVVGFAFAGFVPGLLGIIALTLFCMLNDIHNARLALNDLAKFFLAPLDTPSVTGSVEMDDAQMGRIIERIARETAQKGREVKH
jgi:hypothetical protein